MLTKVILPTLSSFVKDQFTKVVEFRRTLTTEISSINQELPRKVANIALKTIQIIAGVAVVATLPLALLISVNLLLIAPVAIIAGLAAHIASNKLFGESYVNPLKSLKTDMNSVRIPNGRSWLKNIQSLEKDLKEQIAFVKSKNPACQHDLSVIALPLDNLKTISSLFILINDANKHGKKNQGHASQTNQKPFEINQDYVNKLNPNYLNKIAACVDKMQNDPEWLKKTTQSIVDKHKNRITPLQLLDELIEANATSQEA
jgi:hypothetical protein